MPGLLDPPVSAFVAGVAGALAALSGKGPEQHRTEAVVEASNLVLGVLAADGRATDDELWAYAGSVGKLLDPPLVANPTTMREARLLEGKEIWLRRPSALVDLLVRADERSGTRHAEAYYTLALALAHAAAAVDLVPSPDEIAAIDEFRNGLLAAFDRAGLARPGSRQATRAPDPPPPSRGDVRDGTPQSPPATEVDAVPPAEPLEVLLAELDELVGLGAVKAEVHRLTSLLQVEQLRRERGLPVAGTSHHLVFTGNPGTGKTTVARLLSRIYRSLGIVTKGHLVETDRSALVAGYVGQTAGRTRAVLESALGGTCLIDEAYALARGGENDFGREAIDTLVKFMEDHRDDLAIVAAGYPVEMHELIETNPGLRSRFTRTLHFDDYSTEELVEIFARIGDKQEYVATETALAALAAIVASEPRTRGFGNARFVRNVFEAAIAHQALRLAPLQDVSTEQLTTLTAADVVGGAGDVTATGQGDGPRTSAT